MRNILMEKCKEFGALLLASVEGLLLKHLSFESALSSEKGNCLTSADCIYKGQSEVLLYP